MADESKEGEGVKVIDRRRFTPGGELRPDAPPLPAMPLPPTPVTPSPIAAAAPTESEAGRQARQAFDRQRPRGDYRVEFETLVMSLSTSAMYQLGLVDDPQRGAPPADLESARHTIDMLAVLQEKTRGNLGAQEQRLVEQVLYELRLAYVSVSTGKKPSPPRAGA